MISLRIKDVKTFMSKLLIKDTFDTLLLSEASINTGCSYTINGQLNRMFYTDDEWETFTDRTYSAWADIRPFCFSLIKGRKVPTSMKLVMLMPSSHTAAILDSFDSDITHDNINGLFLNIRYSEGHVNIITGTSLNIFTLDRQLDTAFDAYIRSFLLSSGLDFEEM